MADNRGNSLNICLAGFTCTAEQGFQGLEPGPGVRGLESFTENIISQFSKCLEQDVFLDRALKDFKG